ncbi:hypothetical protein PCANC_26834 [Puccinia coronata f. sp. avenae]|uniref:Shieldin complex subunit 2 first OB fold domain-containing protein n=1 Tax=Puccinia coronata f. sp. avenae TaxID=200324 RepID=A0A2N5TES1_9BASI|nr:hypothetical protein PCASD_14164 [Puccinia coronata f. sp. avenae]PLW25000.1 hypothetical protein PCANC_26834 [Puccinia coronata f. sp. avenae]
MITTRKRFIVFGNAPSTAQLILKTSTAAEEEKEKEHTWRTTTCIYTAPQTNHPDLHTQEQNEENTVTAITTHDEESLDYYQSQLDYRDSFEDTHEALSSTATPGNKSTTSCLLSHPTQPASHHHQHPQHGQSQSLIAHQQASPPSQTTYTESMIVNPPAWHFDVRACTPIDQLQISAEQLYSIIFYLAEKKPLSTIELKKPRWNGAATVDIAHFECMDHSGSVLKLVLWDEVAGSLSTACLTGDIIYLSGIAISTYQGKLQANTTAVTRAQICYRTRPAHASHVDLFCPDLRLAYDATTHHVAHMVQWAKAVFG